MRAYAAAEYREQTRVDTALLLLARMCTPKAISVTRLSIVASTVGRVEFGNRSNDMWARQVAWIIMSTNRRRPPSQCCRAIQLASLGGSLF
jgi:hypothetical protein